MRNLKRALSLTLASVMLLGMMVVGSSAAAGYSDVDENDNVEAIEVLQAVEVMVGDDRGFGPDRPVTRNEMAVVMGKLLNLDYNYYTSTCPFNDVADWAKGWVGACAANGIVSGRGNGIYDGESTVTAVEAASMMMRALGYFKYQNDYADGFMVSTVRQGTKIGIFDGVGTDATTPMTRNQVAQMALNALQSGMVEPDGNTINLTTPDGSVFTGKVNYVFRTSGKPFATAISSIQATAVGSQNGGAIVELGEQLYNGDLKLNDYQIDAFGRPARQWDYKGNDIGTYVKKELFRKEYTDTVTGKDLYDLLTKSTVEDYSFRISVDGEIAQGYLGSAYFTQGNLIRSNTEKVGETGKGVLTQVFVDPDEGANGKVYIAIINTYLAKAEDDYSEKKDEAYLTVYKIQDQDPASNITAYVKAADDESMTISGEDFDIKDIKEDDLFLVRVAEGEIKELVKPEILSKVSITSFKDGSWVNADGTKYDYADTARYDKEVLEEYDEINMKDVTFNVILDKYGYMIGLEQNEDPDQYVFITGIDTNGSNRFAKEADANAIFLDGTMKSIKVDMEKSETQSQGSFSEAALWNTWCTYSVNSNDVYTLTEVADNNTDFKKDSNGSAYTAPKTNDKLGQGKDQDTAALNNKYVTIDKSHVSLVGITKDSAGAVDATSTYKKVYGNDETVYINVSTKEINANVTVPTTGTKTQAIIIDEVDSVSTGVKNTSLNAWNAKAVKSSLTTASFTPSATDANTSNGVYTLFKDNGYVIAAIVVGEDDGVTSNYAYAYGDKDGKAGLNQEDWRGDEGDWKWSRDVIIDGQVVTLQEIGDTVKELSKMNHNRWYEVKYKADGTVRKVTPINLDNGDTTHDDFEFCTSTTPANYKKFVGKIEFVENANDNNNGKAVLFENMSAAPYTLTAKKHTLEVTTNTGDSKGFSVADDARTILIQDVLPSAGSVKVMNKMYDFTGGTSGLERAIKYINDNHSDGKFRGYISAVFENGMASSIIIYDVDPTNVNQGTSGSSDLTVNLTVPTKVKVVYDHTNSAPTETQALAAVIAELNKGGRTVTSTEKKNGVYTFQTKTVNGTIEFTEEFKWAVTDVIPDNAVKIYKNDNSEIYVDPADSVADALGLTENEKLFIKDADGNYVSTDTTVVANKKYDERTVYAEITVGAGPATKVDATSTVGAALSKTPSTTVFAKRTDAGNEGYVATGTTVAPGAVYDGKEYVAINLTATMDASGATAANVNGATFAVALANNQDAYVEKNASATVNLTVTITGTTANAALQVANDGSNPTATVASGGSIAAGTTGTQAVSVTLNTSASTDAVTITLKITD